MDSHIMETLIVIGALATVGTQVLTFLQTTKEFKRMNDRGKKVLDRLGVIIEELKE